MPRSRDSRRPGRRRGTVAVLATLCLVPVIGVLAFVLDGGLMLGERRRAVTIAQASAHAAACSLYKNYGTDLGLDPRGTAAALAMAIASANGYTNDGTTSTVTVNIPPRVSTLFVGQPGYAEVVVKAYQPRRFSAIFGSGNLTIAARSVARGTFAPYSGASLIALDPSAPSSLAMAGSAHVIASSTIQVNSSNSAAINANNAGYAKAPTIAVRGNYVTSGSGYLNGSVVTGASAVSDPLSFLAAPDPATLTPRGSIPGYGSFAMSPGVYSGGVSVGGGSTVTMNPGVYYMKGGSFSIANGATVTGSGVMIYVDNGGGQVSFQGGGNITLGAPTSGPYTGVLIFQDRSSTQPISIANGSTSNLTGTVYALSAAMNVAGGATSQYGSQIIVKTMNLSNNADVRINYGNGTVARGRSLNVVE